MSGPILNTATNLRATIEQAAEGGANIPWLARFPTKCCNFAANLLLLDLSASGVGALRRMIGTVQDERGDDLDTHVWVLAGDLVVDITADIHGQTKVIVEQQSAWHNSLHDTKPFLPKQDLEEGIADSDLARLRNLYEQVLGELAPFRVASSS